MIRYVKVFMPEDNIRAYRKNDNLITCRAIYENSTADHSCFAHLNVKFEPFVDNTVKLNQVVCANKREIECPIRAPNFPPYEYHIFWIRFNRKGRVVLFAANYTLTSYFYPIEKVVEGDIYSCSLSQNNSILMSVNITVKREAPMAAYVEYNLVSLWSLLVLPLLVGLTALKYRSAILARLIHTNSQLPAQPIIHEPRLNCPLLSYSSTGERIYSNYTSHDIIEYPLVSPRPESLNSTINQPVPSIVPHKDIFPTLSRTSSYLAPIVCMAGMASMVLNGKTTVPGSPICGKRLHDKIINLNEHAEAKPNCGPRLHDRIMQLSYHVEEQADRDKLRETAGRAAGKKNRLPSFV